MILAEKNNDAQLMALLPSIQHHINEWQIVHFNVLKTSTIKFDDILKRLCHAHENYDGLIYAISPTKVIMLARFGLVHNYDNIKKDIEKNIPKHCCRVKIQKMNAAGIKQLNIDIISQETNTPLDQKMYYKRQNRSENVLMVADDDKLVRMTMSKMLSTSGNLVEVESGNQVITNYQKYNPDIIFLDIHMPGKNGLELIQDIMAIDPDAFIIVLSADSSAQNVVKALDEGAVGFLSKPPLKEKVQEYVSQCITIR